MLIRSTSRGVTRSTTDVILHMAQCSSVGSQINRSINKTAWRLEALAVNDARARLVVLLLGDPHLLEGGQRGKDRAANPDGVLALRGSHDLDGHGGRGQGGHFLLHALGNALE